ncbi:MAG TPA: CopG family antitoxin [Rhizomicrobium sp.]|nr:CopG family antitoxin [Rhizomicrobium sp.]
MTAKTTKITVPVFKTDAEAEAFLEQDLSNLDFSQFKPIKFEFEKKDDDQPPPRAAS